MGKRWVLLASAALVAACQLVLDTDKIAIPPERDASAGADSDAGGGARDASGDSGESDGGPDSGTVEVLISSPVGEVHVNGAVTFEVTVTGAVPSKVELLRDGAALAELRSRPYTFAWDTAGVSSSEPVPEGTYRVAARATFDGYTRDSPAVTVVVDRAPPTAEKRPLPPGDANVGVREPLQMVFSEPLSPDAASEQGVGVTASCGSVTWSRSLSADGKTLSLRALSAVGTPCTLTASLGDSCRDLAGNRAAPATMTWTMPVWQLLGDPLSTNAGAYSLAVNAAGEPVVAYEEAPGSPGAHLLVKKWSGSAWVAVGAPLGAASAASPALDLDATGAPTVAWVEGTAAPRVLKAARFASGDWVQYPAALTQSSGKQGDPSHPGIALASSDGSPWLAFQDATPGSNNIGDCVQSWDGTSRAWVWRGCRAAGYAGGVSLAMEGDAPLFAFSYWDESELSVLSWSGSAWVARGGKPSYGLEPSLAANAHGAVIAWKSKVSDVGKIFAKVWDGSDWAPRLASPSTLPPPLSYGAARAPSAAVDATLGPVVAWLEPGGGYYVKRQNAGSWTLVGSTIYKTPPQSDLLYGPSLATDKAGGNLSIAWSQAAALYVMRLNR